MGQSTILRMILLPLDVRGKSLEETSFSKSIWWRVYPRVNGNSPSLTLRHVMFLINDGLLCPICSPGLWWGPDASHYWCSKKSQKPENLSQTICSGINSVLTLNLTCHWVWETAQKYPSVIIFILKYLFSKILRYITAVTPIWYIT